MGRSGGHCASLRALRHGPHGARSRHSAHQRRPGAQQHPTAVDTRHLRISGGGIADHHGRLGRPVRPATSAPDRRRDVRAHVHPGCILQEFRDADRIAGAPGPGRRHLGTVDALADQKHVSAPNSAHLRDRRLGNQLFGRRCDGSTDRGLVLQHYWWGAVFLIGVPVMLLLLLLGPVLLPEYRDPAAGRLDILSAALSLAAVLLVIFGVKQLAESGWGWIPLAAVASGIIVGWLFVARQRRLADPLIDLHLFHSPAFTTALAAYTLATFVGFGIYIYIAQYLQLVLGLSPFMAGLYTVPSMSAYVVGSMMVPVLARRIRRVYVMSGGLAIAAVGFLLLTLMEHHPSVPVLIVGMLIYSLGLCPIFILATDLIVGSAPAERAGAAAALSETSSELGGALGIALLGSIGTSVYRGAMAAAIPIGIPMGVAEAARRTLGGAVSEAGRLGDAAGAELLDRKSVV